MTFHLQDLGGSWTSKDWIPHLGIQVAQHSELVRRFTRSDTGRVETWLLGTGHELGNADPTSLVEHVEPTYFTL